MLRMQLTKGATSVIELKHTVTSAEDIQEVNAKDDGHVIEITIREKNPSNKSYFWIRFFSFMHLVILACAAFVILATLSGYPDISSYEPLSNILRAWFFGHLILLLVKNEAQNWKK